MIKKLYNQKKEKLHIRLLQEYSRKEEKKILLGKFIRRCMNKTADLVLLDVANYKGLSKYAMGKLRKKWVENG